MSDLNDQDLYNAATNDEPIAEVTAEPTPEPQAEASGDVVRDEKGRFAPKEQVAEAVTEQPQAEVAPQVQPDNAAHVPSWRLREVNDAREAAERRYQESEARYQAVERQLAEMRQQAQPKPEPVDFYADPDAALKQRLDPVEQRIQQMQVNFNVRASKVEAVSTYGREAVTEMEKSLDEAMKTGHPGLSMLRAQMVQSEDPVGVAMQWHQREKLLKETGGDLSAYKSRTLEDALKDPAFLAKALEAAKSQASGQQPGTRTNLVQLPPSLNRAASSGSPHDDAGDMSDASLYGYATR